LIKIFFVTEIPLVFDGIKQEKSSGLNFAGPRFPTSNENILPFLSFLASHDYFLITLTLILN